MYAERTGRTDFSETTDTVAPRTQEQLKEDQLKLKQLIKVKRAEKDLAEKKRKQAAEVLRRKGGQSSGSIKEEMLAKQRKVQWAAQKKEKKKVAMERERLRRELAKDKAERKARGGKLAGKLGADGYAPAANNLNPQEQQAAQQKMKEKAMEERRKILAKGGVKGFVQDMPKEERLEKALKALSIQKARDAGKGKAQRVWWWGGLLNGCVFVFWTDVLWGCWTELFVRLCSLFVCVSGPCSWCSGVDDGPKNVAQDCHQPLGTQVQNHQFGKRYVSTQSQQQTGWVEFVVECWFCQKRGGGQGGDAR